MGVSSLWAVVLSGEQAFDGVCGDTGGASPQSFGLPFPEAAGGGFRADTWYERPRGIVFLLAARNRGSRKKSPRLRRERKKTPVGSLRAAAIGVDPGGKSGLPQYN
jgi:hypothetical protein